MPLTIVILAGICFLLHAFYKLEFNAVARDTQKQTTGSYPVGCREPFDLKKGPPNASEKVGYILDSLKTWKNQRKFIPSEAYGILSEVVPSMLSRTNPGMGLAGTNITVNKRWRLQQAEGRLEFLPCRLHTYLPSNLQECLVSRADRGKRTRIAFLGDSTIRQMLELLLDALRRFDLKITTHKGEIITVDEFFGPKASVLWAKYKHRLTVESPKELPKFFLEFIWAPILHRSERKERPNDFLNYVRMKDISVLPNETLLVKWGNDKKDEMKIRSSMDSMTGAKETLERWSHMPQEELPDLVVLGTGIWHLKPIGETFLKVVDQTSLGVMRKLHSVLAKISKKTAVLWMLPDPLKEYIAEGTDTLFTYKQQSNAVLEWMSNAQTQFLPKDVILWDSFIPFVLRAIKDCQLMLQQGIDMNSLPVMGTASVKHTWKCLERAHVGFEVVTVAVQMILNSLCNGYSSLSSEFCCA